MTARLAVRVHPGAAVERLTGRRADGTIRLSVRAAPEGGQANRAVTELLAAVLGVPPSRVTVAGGAASRSKRIAVEGLEQAEAERRIDRALKTGERADGD